MLVAVVASCNSKDQPIPIKGTVMLDGKPVAGAAVRFTPGQGGGRPAFGATQEDGSYRLTTVQPEDGALPGEYIVTILWEAPTPPVVRPGAEGPSRAQMQKAQQDYQEKMKRLGKGPVIPEVYGDPVNSPLRQKVPPPDGQANFALSSKGP